MPGCTQHVRIPSLLVPSPSFPCAFLISIPRRHHYSDPGSASVNINIQSQLWFMNSVWQSCWGQRPLPGPTVPWRVILFYLGLGPWNQEGCYGMYGHEYCKLSAWFGLVPLGCSTVICCIYVFNVLSYIIHLFCFLMLDNCLFPFSERHSMGVWGSLPFLTSSSGF